MTQAKVRRLHTALYSTEKYPPMPPRIRLAATCWERVWTVTVADPIAHPEKLPMIIQRLTTDTITIRAHLKTSRRICFAITTMNLDDQSEFELAMIMMSRISSEMGEVVRVEDRPAHMWPIQNY